MLVKGTATAKAPALASCDGSTKAKATKKLLAALLISMTEL